MLPSEFSALYETSYRTIYQLVYSIEKSRQAAEDTVQEIYLAAWVRFRQESHPNPLGWLIITARHKAYDALRRQLREAKYCTSLEPSSPDLPPAQEPACFDIYPFLEEESAYCKIRPILRDDEFNLILAHYDQGFSVNELARKLQISVSACYMRLHRARKKLEILRQA